ncbi:hypothetical protein GQ55_9G427500 [Panicum hallii var. hallii]|uniref:Uncharacterized protein n=1 Tax=Panicum hallii var. hallii TaxID=1504633 RepID=A0A2T7CAW6_9POAL|nr:hypothetical protein GQ55_9G427500 [Panicum hallii var. hallii]
MTTSTESPVSSLRADVTATEQDEVSQALLDRFRCAPVFSLVWMTFGPHMS